MSDPSVAAAPGRVVLIGAGPGAADLLTLRAARALAAADVVIHDRQARDAVRALARPDAETHEIEGPEAGALMLRAARGGALVARLRSGRADLAATWAPAHRRDPERDALDAAGVAWRATDRRDPERDALDAAGVAWELVPGVAAAPRPVAPAAPRSVLSLALAAGI